MANIIEINDISAPELKHFQNSFYTITQMYVMKYKSIPP